MPEMPALLPMRRQAATKQRRGLSIRRDKFPTWAGQKVFRIWLTRWTDGDLNARTAYAKVAIKRDPE
ncbi:hypothetical protein C9E81_09655 [Paracoccus alkanivorans]|uniref:Uncharacterized protein n=1 Tax=Paracoccus alkanivorans TaxID=2116655 RepID=A0A3M0MVY8_9RHOB|nr:hypothetical protein C9E81_09655 [Paracoccus alkanivorans]